MKYHLIRDLCTALNLLLFASIGPCPNWQIDQTIARDEQSAVTQKGRGHYARIAFLRAHDGHSTDFEAGYIRHLQWHKEAGDTWVWYGWSVSIGERQRWFAYATFGHSPASLDAPVSPAEDERDSLINVIPYCEFMGSGLYEFLPALSRGTGDPRPAAKLEFTTIELTPGTTEAFEKVIRAQQSALQGETLWYRMVAGGAIPRYVRLRPAPNYAAILDGKEDAAFSEETNHLILRTTKEIFTLRPTMSLGIEPSSR